MSNHIWIENEYVECIYIDSNYNNVRITVPSPISFPISIKYKSKSGNYDVK